MCANVGGGPEREHKEESMAQTKYDHGYNHRLPFTGVALARPDFGPYNKPIKQALSLFPFFRKEN